MLHKNNLMLNGGEIFPAVFFVHSDFILIFAEAKQPMRIYASSKGEMNVKPRPY